MDAKSRYSALVLGLVGLLAVPAAALNTAGNRTVDPGFTGPPAILLAAGGSLLATGAQTPATPKDKPAAAPEIVVTGTLFDFGRVLEGTAVEHDFLIENRGSGDLAIDQVKTG